LVTEGIQKGHMRLQLKSLVSSIGATEKEIPLVVSKLEKLNKRDMSTAKEILDNLRNEGK
jgi:hydroxymethylglutaryl-CoA reductase